MTEDWATACEREIEQRVRLSFPTFVAFGEYASIISAHTAPLVALLREGRREHTHCEDSFYCCARCRHADHVSAQYDRRIDETAGGNKDACTCGADAWNARIDAVLAKL